MADPAWKKSLRRATFRGVPFYVESADGTFGRRVVVHEFPRKAEAYAEDLGRKAREFSIEGFVLGDEYFGARDALLAACQEAGQGELIHPYLGKYTVACTGVTMRETIRDGGLARFSLKFVETAAPTAPRAEVDATSALKAAQTGFLADCKLALQRAWQIVGVATFVADKAVAATEAVLDEVETAQRKVRGALNEVADLGYKVRTIRANINAVISAPEKLADEIDLVFDGLVQAFGASEGGSEEASQVLQTFFTTLTVLDQQLSAPAVTPSQLQIQSNAQALSNYVRQLAIAYQAEALGNRTFESAQQAATLRTQSLDAIDAVEEDATDAVFSSLQALRVAITRAVPPPGQTLASETTVPVVRTAPSLVLVYDLFDDIASEADLVARNGIRHPGFVPAGEQLRVLNG